MIRFLQTPGKTKKFFLSAMLLLICVAMLIYLIPQSGSNDVSQPNVLAKVGDDTITVSDVQRRVQEFARFGQRIPPAYLGQFVDYLINDKAQLYEARRLGLRVSNEELRDDLQNGPLGQMFFPEGKFIGEEKYANLVSQNWQMTVDKFEDEERAVLLENKLNNLVTSAISISPDEIQREFERQNLKVKLQYAVLNLADIAKSINPTDTEIKAYYDAHKAQYANSTPEKRKAKYVVVDLARLAASAQVTPAEIQDYYAQHRPEFTQQEQVKASHILVKTANTTDAAARKKAEDLLKQLRAGANFEELARKNSDDPGSAMNGGSLGWFNHGAMVPEFDKAAFSQPKGQIGDLVKTQFGYHIIRVDDKHPAGVAPLDQVKDRIEAVLKQQKAQQQAGQLADAIQRQAATQGLDAAAAQHQLQVVNADWFARNDSLPGIGRSQELMVSVFTAQEKSPPQLVGTQQGYVVFQLIGVKPPSTPSFEDVRKQVAEQFKNERAFMVLAQKGQELSDRAHALHDLKKAAKELSAEVKESDWLGVTGQAPDIGNMGGPANVAFSMKVGEISMPISTAGRNQIVLMVTDRQEPTPSDLAKSQDAIRDQLLQQRKRDAFQLYIAGLTRRLEKEGKIKRNQQQINQFTQNAAEGG